MLEKIRENSRSVLVWVLFGIIIAFFVISFGPQASESQFSCGGASESFVLKVGDEAVDIESFRYAANTLGITERLPSGTGTQARAMRARERVLDALLERELLAQAAEEMGLTFSEEEVTRSLYDLDTRDGAVLALRNRFRDHINEAGEFDDKQLMNMARTLGLSGLAPLMRQQKRELLANAMRIYLVSTPRVAADEARGSYEAENRTAAVKFVKFAKADYKRGLDLSDERLEAWLADNEAKAKERYDADKEALYTGTPKQFLVRNIFVQRENAPTPTEGSTGNEASEEEVNKDGDDGAPDPGLAVVSAARARIEAGEDFAAVARELSQGADKESGGLLGWRSLSSLGLEPEVSGAVQELAVGAVSEVIEAPRGFYLIRFEEAREGDLAFEQVKLEIARKIAADDIALEIARVDAEAALAQLSAGGTLESLFGDRPEPTPAGDDEAEGDSADDAPPPGPAYAFPETELPRPDGLEAPALQTARRVTRQGAIVAGANLRPYVGRSAELVKKVFGDLEIGAKPSEVIEVDDGLVLVEVSEREEPDFEKFDSIKNQSLMRAAQAKGFNSLQDWLAERCTEATANDQVKYDPEYVTYYDDNEKAIQVDYQPCQTTAQLNAMRRLGLQ